MNSRVFFLYPSGLIKFIFYCQKYWDTFSLAQRQHHVPGFEAEHPQTLHMTRCNLKHRVHHWTPEQWRLMKHASLAANPWTSQAVPSVKFSGGRIMVWG